MDSSADLTLRFLRPLALWLQSTGHDAASAFSPEVAIADVLTATSRLSLATTCALFARAETLAGRERIGFEVLAVGDPRIVDFQTNVTDYLVLQALANSATLEAGLANLARFYTVSNTAADASIEKAEGRVRFRLELDEQPPGARSFLEYSVGAVARLAAFVVARPVSTMRVAFAHAAPRAGAPRFEMPVHYDQPFTGIEVAAAEAATPLRTARAALLERVERELDRELKSLAGPADLVARAEALLRDALTGGDANAERIAEKLGVSTRTLSRRLRAEGTSHKQLLDRVRQDMAMTFLRERERSLDEIASLLGFAEASTFHRAFRRWTGVAPGEYRARVTSDRG